MLRLITLRQSFLFGAKHSGVALSFQPKLSLIYKYSIINYTYSLEQLFFLCLFTSPKKRTAIATKGQSVDLIIVVEDSPVSLLSLGWNVKGVEKGEACGAPTACVNMMTKGWGNLL